MLHLSCCGFTSTPRPNCLPHLPHMAQVFDLMGYPPSHENKINIHIGTRQGSKAQSLARFAAGVERLSDACRARLTGEAWQGGVAEWTGELGRCARGTPCCGHHSPVEHLARRSASLAGTRAAHTASLLTPQVCRRVPCSGERRPAWHVQHLRPAAAASHGRHATRV